MPVRCSMLRPIVALLAAALGCWLALAGAAPASAQIPPSALAAGASKPEPAAADPARPSAAEVDRLAKTLEDPAQRAELIRRLRLLAQASAPPGETAEMATRSEMVLGGLAGVADAVARAIIDAGALIASAPELADWLADQLDDAESRGRWLRIFGELAIVFGVAGLVKAGAWWVLRGAQRALAVRRVDGQLRRVPYAALRGLIELVPVAAFAAIAYGALALLPPEFAARYVSLTVVRAVVLAGIAMAAARAVLMPDLPGLRAVPLGDESANYVMIWVRRFIAIGIYGFAALDIAFLIGLPVSIYELARRIVGLLLAGLAVVFILQNRLPVSAWLRAGPDAGADADPPPPRAASAFRGWLAETWHLLAIAYVALLAIVWLLEVPSGLAFVLRASGLSVAIIACAAMAQAGTRRLIRRVFSVDPDLARDFPNIESRANRYMVIVGVVASAVIMAIALILVLQAWGLQSLGWLSSPLGQRLTGGLVSILVVGLLALFVWEVVDRVIERSLQRLSRQAPTAGSAMRLRTFLPLLRNVALVVLATVFVLVALSEIGVDITPLLAGASIIGIAVAFGANALVKDVITGLFILIEGTINVGDVVEVDSRSGVVEGLSIRTMRLRDATGAVHTIPFSNVAAIKNMTRDFSFVVINASVGYGTDLAAAMRVMAEVEESIRADPAFTAMISAPLEMQGVDRFTDSAIIISARIRTPPGKQWTVGREFNRRMKEAFDRAGIEIPFPHQVVIGEGGARREETAPIPTAGQTKATHP